MWIWINTTEQYRNCGPTAAQTQNKINISQRDTDICHDIRIFKRLFLLRQKTSCNFLHNKLCEMRLPLSIKTVEPSKNTKIHYAIIIKLLWYYYSLIYFKNVTYMLMEDSKSAAHYMVDVKFRKTCNTLKHMSI
jgi:hypothetical protein